MQSIVPLIAYEDAGAASDWLCRVFGFKEIVRRADEVGVCNHVELQMDDGVVFIASPTPAYRGPRRHAETCADAREWQQVPWVIDGVMVYVDDIDAHFEQTKSAGAKILSGIDRGSPGDRYRVEDCEGHRWMFIQR